MDELLETLEDIKPNVDFKTCMDLIDGRYLDSFDILFTINGLNNAFGVEISPMDIAPGSFNSTGALWKMVQRLDDD